MTLLQTRIFVVIVSLISVWLLIWYLKRPRDEQSSVFITRLTTWYTKRLRRMLAQCIEHGTRYSESLKTVAIIILLGLGVVQFKYAAAAKRVDAQHVAAAYKFVKAVENSRVRTIKTDSLALDTAASIINDSRSTKHDRKSAVRVVNIVLTHALEYREMSSAADALTAVLRAER